jgi:TRAP-type C4-dicarboxylate transport system substrate-binding protein
MQDMTVGYGRTFMSLLSSASRRTFLKIAAAAPALSTFAPGISRAAAANVLKISHQFPGGTVDEGDFRDRLCRKFAIELEKATGGALGGEVYPNSSLVKTNAQFSAMRKGALDMSFYPLSYAGGEVPEVNIGLMPCLVSSYAQGKAWKTAPVGKRLVEILAEKGIIIVSWIWQAGGLASRANQIVGPDEAKGMKIRGGSREMDMMFKAAGAAVLSIPSNEGYAAMQTGSADAVVTSSTSLISFRMEEVAKHLTSGGERSYWFMFEPLLMSKSVFDALPKAQQDAIMGIGAQLEEFGYAGAAGDDTEVVKVFEKKGGAVHKLDEASLAKWRDIAKATAWKDFNDKSASCAEMLKLAVAVS